MSRLRPGGPEVPPPDNRQLTPREIEMLRHLATDLRPPAVAALLHIEVSSAYGLTYSINAKLGTRNYHASVMVARQMGII